MPTFQYEAMDNTGREVKDTIDASTQEEAQQLIRQKGFFVTKISERSKAKKKGPAQAKKGGRKGKKKSFTIGRISTKQLCTFTRQLSTLQDAGLPILRSLKILEGQCKPGVLKNSLGEVVEDIESGATLSDAFAKHPKAFDRLYCNMIKAGEAGGALEAILQRLADFKEKSQSLKRRIKSAMVYPIVVITVACAIVGFILYFIIPKFEAIFKDFGVDLPSMTKFLITASHFVVNYFYVVILVAGVLLDLPEAGLSEQDGRLYLRPDPPDDPGHGSDRREVDGRPDDADAGHPGPVGRADPGVAQHRPRHRGQRLATLDRIVTVDSMVAHLAGSLGLPAIVLLRAGADWRWGEADMRCGLYPAHTLLRQRCPGRWDDVIARAASLLRQA